MKGYQNQESNSFFGLEFRLNVTQYSCCERGWAVADADRGRGLSVSPSVCDNRTLRPTYGTDAPEKSRLGVENAIH